jgi:hypothetical protein
VSGSGKEQLKIYEIAIFLAFFCACYLFSAPYREKLFLREIKADGLHQMSAEEYMNMMFWTSKLTVSDVLYDWPHKKDIPYLLSRVDSYIYSGTTSCENSKSFEEIGDSIRMFGYDYGTTQGAAAVRLLKAIKKGKFEGYWQGYPYDKDEIIAWARAEAAKMEQEKAQTRNAPPP